MVVDNQVSFDEAEAQINAATAALQASSDFPDYEYEFNTDFGVNAIAMVDNSPRPVNAKPSQTVAADSVSDGALKGASGGSSVSGIGNRPGAQSVAQRTGAGGGWGSGTEFSKLPVLKNYNFLHIKNSNKTYRA